MATIKVILRTKENKDGTFPLAIRITKDRKSSFIHLGHSIKKEQWDATEQKVKKSHPNSARLNNLILKQKAEAYDTLLNLQASDENISSTIVRQKIKPAAGVSFFAQAEIFIDNMRKVGKYNRVKPDQSRINTFKRFLGHDISFQEITVPLLNKFKAWLKVTTNISERSVINTLIIIRTVYNQAIQGGIINKNSYPFGKGKIQIQFPQSIKIGLTTEEVKKIELLKLKGYENHARNVWLTSFYFAGMRISDVLGLKWSDIQDNRLNYKMGKNDKVGSLKVSEKVLQVFAQYKKHAAKHDLIFPELKALDELDLYNVQRKTSYAVKRLNTTLKEVAKLACIYKPLTMHIARHTFGNISGDKIPIQMLQKLYRHSSLTTTIGYQSNFIYRDVDDALTAVIGD